MAYEPRDGSGSAFKNTRKDKETQPDWRGDAMIDGKRYSFAIWEKDGAKGQFLSFKFEDYKERPAETPTSKPKPISNEPAFSDEIPF